MDESTTLIRYTQSNKPLFEGLLHQMDPFHPYVPLFMPTGFSNQMEKWSAMDDGTGLPELEH